MHARLARLPPPSYGFVMATGILAVAARQQGWPRLALGCFEFAFLAWLLSGHPSSLWFLWVAGVYGIVLCGRWISGGSPHRDRDRRRDRRRHG